MFRLFCRLLIRVLNDRQVTELANLMSMEDTIRDINHVKIMEAVKMADRARKTWDLEAEINKDKGPKGNF